MRNNDFILQEESIQLPERILGQMKQYDELFTKLKPNRTLAWKHNLGQVTKYLYTLWLLYSGMLIT